MSDAQVPDETSSSADESENALPQLKGFKILAELARTPKGIIYKCKREVEGDVVAVKVYRRSLCDKEFIQRVSSNSEKAFFLDAGGLAKCLGCINDEGHLLLIAEYASGQPLSKLLHKQMGLNTAQCLSIALQCARVLKYSAGHKCHHGRLHPADVILGEKTVRMTGVGLGERPEHAAWQPKDPYLYEPLMYTAPEAMPSLPFPADSDGMIAADVYALGGILYQLLTLKPVVTGADEATIVAEREKLGRVAVWPADSEVPPNIVEFVEKMLAVDPKQRPTPEEMVSVLTRALAALQNPPGVESGAVQDKPSAELAGMRPAVNSGEAKKKQESNKNIAPAKKIGSGVPKAIPAASAPKSWLKSAAAQIVNRSDDARTAKAEKMYTSVLLVMTAVILLSVVVVAKIFLIDPLRTPHSNNMAAQNPATQTPAAQPRVQQPPAVQTTAAQPKVQPPENKPAAVESAFNLPIDPNGDPRSIAARQLTLIQEMLQKGEIQYSGALLKFVKTIPDRAGRDTPAGVRAMLLANEIEETINGGGAPRPLASPVSTPPAPVTPAPAPQPAAIAVVPAPAAPDAPAAAASTNGVSAAGLKSALNLARTFKHADALNELTAMGRTAGGEDKKILAAFTKVLQAESDVFNRCRSRLKEQIEKHPKKESPLQVFPRKNDPVGDDIVDFDDVGLKIAEKKDGNIAIRIRQWKNVPPLQAFNMMQLLADKRSSDDQTGLAAFAYTRGLKEQIESSLATARALTDGGMKAGELSNAMEVVEKTAEQK